MTPDDENLDRASELAAAGEDLGDPHDGVVLAMPALAARILAAALLEGDDLVAALMRDDFAGDGGARNGRRADRRRVAADHEHFAERHHFARILLDAVDPDHVFGGDAVLLAARAHDCEHGLTSLSK